MNYKDFKVETWDKLDKSGDSASGYQSIFLSKQDNQPSDLHVFKNELGKLHFVISDHSNRITDVHDPKVNGLSVKFMKYRLKNSGVQKFIDLECTLHAYAEEFTEIVKEITEGILLKNLPPETAVNDVINNWKSFWGKRPKEILSDEAQIGLICELKVLDKLSAIEPQKSLDAWKGPLNEKFDFIFPDSCLEVKGTRKEGHTHTINGLDQLKTPTSKTFGLISFLATKSSKPEAISLQEFVEYFENHVFKYKPEAIEKFYELLVRTGYNRLHANEYRNLKFEIFNGQMFPVTDNFPKLTSDDLNKPLSSRISELSYKVDLDGLESIRFDDIDFEKYLLQ